MVPARPQPVAEVLVDREHEVDGGWEFEVTVRRGSSEPPRGHRVRLAWVDYEYWSHGSAAPERVVAAVVRAVLELAPEHPLPDRFDAAAARRWVSRSAAARFEEAVRAGTQSTG